MGEIAALYVNVPLVSMGPCWKCGIVYAAPDNFVRQQRELGTAAHFFCPNGHSAHFTKSITDVLKEQLDAEKARREWAERGRDSAQRQASAARGQVTKIKNRVKNGVCPCCKRSFVQLARHMATKHPEYGGGDE